VIQTVTLNFFRFGPISQRLWALAQMGAARFAMPKVPGIGFWKLCGSGTGEGFTPVPNTAVYAILSTWDTLDSARAGQTAAVFQRYRAHSEEAFTLYLTPTAARGTWSNAQPFTATPMASDGPVAALTRATIKPTVAARFWRRVPGISTVIGDDPNVMFKIGIGELPLLHQVTFSIWPNTDTMADFARRGGPHTEAIRAVRAEEWFSEELYARFNVLDAEGTWEGRHPLPHFEDAA
jgi:spheroidene monooxygenase